MLLAACAAGACNGGGSDTPVITPPPPPPPVSYAVERAFPNLTFAQPVAMIQAPGDPSRWYVVEKAGRILVFDNDDATTDVDVFADLRARVSSSASEAGLLSAAFHPGYANNRALFVSYTGGSLESRVAQFFANASGTALNTSSETVLLRLDQPFTNHNGGHIAFGPGPTGPRALLYIAFGDGGSSGDPNGLAQNPFNWFGAILRIDVANLTSYSVPPDNPFANGVDALPEVYAYGFRNPWRFSFDSANGELWLGDVGQNSFEEVDRVVAGGNYGWRCYEGDAEFDLTGCPAPAELEFPVATYANPSEGISVTGGFVYRGAQLTELVGAYLFGDFGSGTIWQLTPSGTGFEREVLVDSGLSIAAFGEDSAGELYVVDVVAGTLHRLIEAP